MKTMIEITNARDAAKDLIRTYALRGDDIDQFRKGYMGSWNSNYHASIGGYIWNADNTKSIKVPNTKVLVEQVHGEDP